MTEKQIEKQIEVIKRAGRKARKSKETAQQFLKEMMTITYESKPPKAGKAVA